MVTKMNNPELVVKQVIAEKFPNCRVALLAGSVIRGDATEQSDLDVVVVDDSISSAYRESIIVNQWKMELFVNTSQSYQEFFVRDCKRGKPSLPQMCVEGKVIYDNGFANQLKKEAMRLIKKGPPPWSPAEIEDKRYGITDLLDDLEGSTNEAEDLFIVGSLAVDIHEFILRTNNQWIGSSKWLVRSLQRYDADLCKKFVQVCKKFYREGKKQPLIDFVDRILAPYGGRLFAGFSRGKEDK